MRIREAVIAAMQSNALIGKPGMAGYLCVRGGRFYDSSFRSKYNGPVEIRLTAMDVLSDEWYLVKDGAVFLPDRHAA